MNHIITNQLDWQARTVADLYKKRWDIEIFFKLMKQNLQIKTFLGTSENAVKSQIFVAMIVYLLLELIRRVYCKEKAAFSNFCEKVRICLLHYLSFEYLCSINAKVSRVIKPPDKTLFDQDKFHTQTQLSFWLHWYSVYYKIQGLILGNFRMTMSRNIGFVSFYFQKFDYE